MMIWKDIIIELYAYPNRTELDHQRVRDMWKNIKGRTGYEQREAHNEFWSRQREFSVHCQGKGGVRHAMHLNNMIWMFMGNIMRTMHTLL